MKSRRNVLIDLIRLYFCFGIALFHFGDSIEYPFKRHGYIGVEFFLIVSGFLLTAHVHREKTQQNYSLAESTFRFGIRRFNRYFWGGSGDRLLS